MRANSKSGSQKDIYAHYDVGNEFYQLWLDETMMYSSGIYNDPGDDLAATQYRKNDRALSRLTDKEGILEIGCGWGGFAERAADQGRYVTGITVSKAQRSYADARLDGRADIRLRDYRDVKGKFDNIVSIEMIEAVGQRYWPSYFSAIKENLAEGGRALIQAITVPDDSFTVRKNIGQAGNAFGAQVQDHLISRHLVDAHSPCVNSSLQCRRGDSI